jgi:recombinational DNA repair ATPase RecF
VSDGLLAIIRARLTADGAAQKPWARLVPAACGGRETLDAALADATPFALSSEPTIHSQPLGGAYLTSISVRGFRGVGEKRALQIASPGPGLTIVAGRNGSGKSSFAEGLEVLLTGDSKRWEGRSKIWKEGWRNLHHPHPVEIEAEVLLDGRGSARISGVWTDGAAPEDQQVTVQPKGKPKTTLEGIGWTAALTSYRPFLSYNELGSMLDEGPSKLYDALSLVLGLEELVVAETSLSKSRLERQAALDAADRARKDLEQSLDAHLAQESDDRAKACRDALAEKGWGVAKLEALLSEVTPTASDADIAILRRAIALEVPDEDVVSAVIGSLRDAAAKLKRIAGSSAESSRHLADLLERALAVHAGHKSKDCPVCGTAGVLGPGWAEATRKEVARLRAAASANDQVHRQVEASLKRARELIQPPPKLLSQLFDIGVSGIDAVKVEWTTWYAGASLTDLQALASHLEEQAPALKRALTTLLAAVAVEIRRREDRWRPIATAIRAWMPGAKAALDGASHIPRIKEAEAWLKGAAVDIRNQRFAPIADKAMAAWQHLRQQSSVELGKIQLVGARGQRRVTLDVTVDGVQGAALGVMSQGELHSLALSLFLPRATLDESPFRFVVIDDPVQSMDPARVDGLARALEETARTRQVIVFTHDERLSEAVRRLNVKCTTLSVTRRPRSVVEIRTALDPVRAHIEDALAVVHTTDLPQDVVRRIVPGFCRSALEASMTSAIRRRLLNAGRPHADVEDELKEVTTVTSLAALALFDDAEKGGDVMKKLNQIGSWAGDVFRQCKEGTHKAAEGDLNLMINDAEKLARKLAELK